MIRKDQYNFAKHSKEWVENSGIQKKNGLFMSPKPKTIICEAQAIEASLRELEF